MNKEWLNVLFLIGFLAQFAFFLRFAVQYIASEKAKRSVTPPLFWKLSLAGNALLFFYSTAQLNFPVSLVQSLNAILSWRNLNLLQQSNRQPSRLSVIVILFITATLCTLFYYLFAPSWIIAPDLHPGIHILGIIGIVLFGLRFWVQWWQAETKASGVLNRQFWQMSFLGAILSSCYFYLLADWPNFVGPFLSIVPYSRNLYFLKMEQSHA